ncbi:Uma2 family endonuclease [Streptomyces sp. PU-14G]|uniref:Uma2 family endonuclease n=1 Tax=Streptomyces sp. PU-14G TaxID=2800808 RepID=UPI0034DF3752
MTVPEPGMTRLRRAAEAAEEATGLRAEIIRGVLMMPPTPRGKHAKVVNVVERQLLPILPKDLDAFQLASVALPHDPNDYATPDLLVCDAAFGDSDDWLAEPGSVVLAVEVVSRGSATKDTRDMVGWYAEANVPAYLVIDPRQGRWTLHTVPKEGTYQGTLHGVYGEHVRLDLEELRTELATDGLPRYAPERNPGKS